MSPKQLLPTLSLLALSGVFAGVCCAAQSPASPSGVQTSSAPPSVSAPDQASLTISLKDALDRARQYSQQFQSASISALLAHEDRIQAKDALLPTVDYSNQFIYTQPNGTPSGVFVSNDGPHVYNSQAVVHGEIYAPVKFAQYHQTVAAEAVARAKTEVAARGLVVTVVQLYYGLVAAQRKDNSAQQSVREARQFVDLTRKQEQGGEVAHADVVKAEIQLEQRLRDAQDMQLTMKTSRIQLAVLLFPDFRQDFTVVDDLQNTVQLPPFEEVQGLAVENNPDL